MQTHPIPEEQWIPFFNRFSQEHVGWPVTIEVVQRDRGPERLAFDLPLQGISFEKRGTRADSMEIIAGDQPQAHVQHLIEKPLKIDVAGDEPDAHDVDVRIEPAIGPVVLAHFHRP